jgi:competence protein ComEC
LFFFTRFFLACFPWVALHWPIKKIAAVAALLGCAFYVVLAGSDVPAQRSLMMTGLVMVAIILDRSPLSLRLIAFSALVVLAIAPHALVGVSFQMSFAAVAALICFFDYIRPWWMAWYSKAGFIRKSFMYLIGILLTSIIAGVMTGFFGLYHFQQFAVYGVLSNMLAVPLTGFVIMPAAIVTLLVMPFGLAAWPIKAMEWGTVWMLAIAHWAASLDDAVIHVSQWPYVTFVFFTGGMVLFLLWKGWRGKGVAVALMVAGLCFVPFAVQPDVYVADSGKLVAVRAEDGDLYFSSGRKDKFAAENWQRMNGREGEKPKTFKDKAAPVACDEEGCRIVSGDKNISILHSRAAYFEDREWADVIVADIPLPEEKADSGKTVIGLFDALDDGAHTVYLRSDEVRVRSVGDEVGERPWSR